MGTTINGVYSGGRRARQERALLRLREYVTKITSLNKKVKVDKSIKDSSDDVPSIIQKKIDIAERDLKNLEDALSGNKKKKEVKVEGEVATAPKERWFIDIHQIHMSMTKRSDRRKNKGKSRKKMKKVRSKSFVKSVVLQPGMLEAYRSGRMGISPRTHSFSTRKEEPEFYN